MAECGRGSQGLGWLLAVLGLAGACGTDSETSRPGVGGAGGTSSTNGGNETAAGGGMSPAGGKGGATEQGGAEAGAGSPDQGPAGASGDASGGVGATGGTGGGTSGGAAGDGSAHAGKGGSGGSAGGGEAGLGGGGDGGGGAAPLPWARVFDAGVNALSVNERDELVLAGTVSANIDLGCGMLANPQPSFAQTDALVASLRSSDGSCRWSYRFSGSDPQTDQAASLDLDGDTVHVGGSFRSATLDFGGGPISLYGGSAGSPSPFVARFHDTGTALVHERSRMFEGRGSVGALAHGASLYLTGTFYAYMSIDGQSATTCCQSFDGMYAASLDSAQARNWITGARVVDSNSIDNVTGMDVAVAGGRVFVAGYADDVSTFAGTLVTPRGYRDAYLAAYELDGTLDWVQHYGAASQTALGLGVLAEPGGTVLFSGVANEGTDLGQGPLTSAAAYGEHLFVMRVNAAGEQLALKTVHVESGEVFDLARRSDGSVVVLGSYRGQRQFGDVTLQSEPWGDAFLAVLSPDLSTFQHVESFTTPHEDFSFGNVSVLSDDSIALALDFQTWVEVRGRRHSGVSGWDTLVTVLE
jgi:hypothetical protein